MPDERARMEVAQALADQLGPEVAAALMECVPPYPWTEIMTKHDLAEFEARQNLRFDVLEARFDAVEARVDGKLDAFGGRLDAFGGRLDAFGGRLDAFGGRTEALIQEKLSAQNRMLMFASAAAIVAIVLNRII